jgi:Tfp pilus assembly protein PilV
MRQDSGFTILETLIALVLLGAGIFVTLASIGTLTQYSRRSQNMTLATMYTSTKLENIKQVAVNEETGGSFGFTYLITFSKYPTANAMTQVDNWTYRSTAAISGTIFTQTTTLQVYPPNGAQSFLNPTGVLMIEAAVTTTWVDDKGLTQSVTLATVLNRRQFVQG